MTTAADRAEASGSRENTSLLRGIAVHKDYAGVQAVRGVDFRIAPNSYVTLLGPSGCGKTSLLRMIGGFEDITSGVIELDGRSLAGVPASQRPVNTVFQNYALFPHLSVEENVGFGLAYRKLSRAEIAAKVEAALAMVQMTTMARRRPRQLSGGQQQRVALARAIGDPTQAHMVAIDARAPLYDGGICTRIDCVSLGVVVNREARRFYDEGEDFWPKRYAIWGRLVAQQPGQIAWSIIDSQAVGRFMPPVFPGTQADTLPELARRLGLDETVFMQTLDAYNAACQPGRFDHTVLDDCHTEGLAPAKTHWARPIVKPPFYGYALKPGITFTYLGLRTDATAAVRFGGRPSDNLFVAGEMMAGNVLGQGYTAGVGMSIGTAFGRIAGQRAAAAAARTQELAHA